jgi:hypothetical protein
VDASLDPWIAIAAAGGVAAGLWLLARGLMEHHVSIRVGDTSTSTISSLAAGEARISGVVEAAEMTLVSLLQSVPCVYYRATIARDGDAPMGNDVVEERSCGFRVRDATGSIRVFPRGARIDAPLRFDDETGAMGDEPPGLSMRTGGATRISEPDRATAIAELLTVREPDVAARPGAMRGMDRGVYRETRLEPGDPVTVVGRALPFSDLSDPVAADYGTEADRLDRDPEIAADLAAARAAGLLAANAADAWGNAAIPGFGIGRPVAAATIDPGANRLPLASAEEAASARATFHIAPETLVVAASAEVPLLIAYGTPGEIVQRSQVRYLLGLAGAVLAIVSAMVLAVLINARMVP